LSDNIKMLENIYRLWFVYFMGCKNLVLTGRAACGKKVKESNVLCNVIRVCTGSKGNNYLVIFFLKVCVLLENPIAHIICEML
jgi:hypothetical protein